MDLFTQGALGAALSQAATRRQGDLRLAGIAGFLAGLAPDIDALIRSPSDPLTFLEYHRHFTHSLAFIPIGGLIVALLLRAVLRARWRLPFRDTFFFCTLGLATHGLLDAATSYGTMLFWPFSDERISWSVVSIVDPAFTLPLTGLIALSMIKLRPIFAAAGLAWALAYLGIAQVQHAAAMEQATQLASTRGHTPVRVEAKPSFANILVWKTIYETPEHFYVDAVRAGVSPKSFPGVMIPKLEHARDLPWLDPATQQGRDIERFRFFSDGFIAADPSDPLRVIDIRYSFVPNQVNALWSIELSRTAGVDDHAVYRTHRRDVNAGLSALWHMIVAR